MTFNQGEVWGGFIVHPYQTLPSQVQALQDFTSASGAGTDPYASVINAYIFGPTGPEAIANQYTYTKPQPYPQILQNFTNIQPQISNSMRVSDLLNITDEVGSGTPNGYRYAYLPNIVPHQAMILTRGIHQANCSELQPSPTTSRSLPRFWTLQNKSFGRSRM